MPGTFTFRPIQANLTHDTEWLGKMDPYCSYRVGPSRIKGPVCRNGGKFPKWEDATVNVPASNEPSIVVDLMDKDKVLFDDNIGSFVIDLQEVQSKGQLSKWYPVYWRQKPAGEILLEAAFQPAIVQQPVVVEQPVIIEKKIIEEPIIVEKVIKEEIVQPVHTTTTHKEFVSGPIIHGISQIHHGGQGIGLVPQHGPILAEGSHIHQGTALSGGLQQGTLNQGFVNQGSTTHHGSIMHPGSTIHQGSTLSGGLQQGTLNQGLVNQGSNFPSGFNQGSLNQGEFTQGGLNQGSLKQGGLNQGGLNQGGLNQGGLNQGGLNQGGLNQGGLNQGGLNQGQF